MSAIPKQIHQGTIDTALLSVPGEDLVAKTLLQLSSVPGFVTIFGPYAPQKAGQNTQPQSQRWADYNRQDWSIRQLPAINVYESETENKDSDQAFLNGTVNIQVYWPPNLRRSDIARVGMAFRGSILNFFASKYVRDMLDELYYIQRPMKVYALNEYGKKLDWSPNIEGYIESTMVPVTLVSVRYRIDLRAWYRALNFMNRTKDQPFLETLADLTTINGEYDGVKDASGNPPQVIVPDEITVTNP